MKLFVMMKPEVTVLKLYLMMNAKHALSKKLIVLKAVRDFVIDFRRVIEAMTKIEAILTKYILP